MTTLARKVCLIGDYGVGKTSLIRRFVDRSFSDQYLTTVGVKISRKLVTLKENLSVQLIIWDLEGSTKFKAVSSTYLQGAMGAIIVADITRPETIGHIEDHKKLFHQVNPQKAVLVALNKSDLLAEPVHIYYDAYFTSAKTGKGVDELFHDLSLKLIGTDT